MSTSPTKSLDQRNDEAAYAAVTSAPASLAGLTESELTSLKFRAMRVDALERARGPVADAAGQIINRVCAELERRAASKSNRVAA